MPSAIAGRCLTALAHPQPVLYVAHTENTFHCIFGEALMLAVRNCAA
jgi:hypothetical protein